MNKQKNALLINLLLLLLVCFLFFVTDGNMPGRIAAVTALSPIYHGKGEAAAPLCVVSWNAAALPKILDKLSDEGIKISFAVSGNWARENPELLLRISQDGHEIVSMGDDPAFDGTLSEISLDIESASNAIEELTGKRPILYYSGTRKIGVSSRAAQKAGMKHLLCTADLLCAKGESEDILRRASEAATKGSIILVQPTEAFFGALDGLISLFKTKGLNVATVSGIL